MSELDYAGVTLDSTTTHLTMGQHLKLIAVNSKGLGELFLGEFTLSEARAAKAVPLNYGVGVVHYDYLRTSFPVADGWDTFRLQATVGGKTWHATINAADWDKELLPAKVDGSGVVVALDAKDPLVLYPFKLAEGAAETADTRRAWLWSLLERRYPYMTGLREAGAKASALRAEAATMLALLEWANDLKDYQAKSLDTARVTAMRKLCDTTQTNQEALNPRRSQLERVSRFADDKQYASYYATLWKRIDETATDIFSTFLNSKEKKPTTRVFMLGEGGGTNGVMNKRYEAIGLIPYADKTKAKAWSEYSLELPALADGRGTLVHVFITGMDGSTNAAKVAFQAGTKSYALLARKRADTSAASASSMFDADPDGAEKPSSFDVKVGDATFKTLQYPDGATFDGRVGDFTFPLDMFAGQASPKFTVKVTAADLPGQKDEMVVGVSVLESYAPVAMFGLYGVDRHVPLRADGSGLDAATKARLVAAYAQLDAIVRLALLMDTFTVELVAGGPGKFVGVNELGSATASEHKTMNAGKTLDGKTLTSAMKQQLRASFIAPSVTGKALALRVASYTDPDAGFVHNQELSARRTWGLLGLFIQRLAEKDKARAQKVWDAAKGLDTTPAGRDLYLATKDVDATKESKLLVPDVLFAP